MKKRVALRAENLATREKAAIRSLVELYLDGVVIRLDERDGTLATDIDELYESLGYESRTDMLEAWGFEVRSEDGLDDEFDFTDPEQFFSELARRYDGREAPRNIAGYKTDNPDLPIMEMVNKAAAIFGHPLVEELRIRGLLPEKSDAGSGTEEMEAAIDELCQRSIGLANAEKPATIEELCACNEDLAKVIRRACSEKLIDSSCLSQYGILAASGTMLEQNGIRTVTAETLLKECEALDIPRLVLPDTDAGIPLPTGIIGIDVDNLVELREVTCAVDDDRARDLPSAGDLALGIDAGNGWSLPKVVLSDDKGNTAEHEIGGGIMEGVIEGSSASPLQQYCGVVAEGVYEGNGFTLLKVRVRLLVAMSGNTVIWLLRHVGYLTDDDVREGLNMGWMARLRLANRKAAGKLTYNQN